MLGFNPARLARTAPSESVEKPSAFKDKSRAWCGAAAARLRFGADSPTAQGPRWHGSARAHVAPLLLRDVARVLRVAQTRRWQAYAVRDSKAAAAGLILVYL